MKIVFNDLSLPIKGKANHIGHGIDEILQLANTLRSIGVEKIIVPSDFYSTEFYGIKIDRIFQVGRHFQKRGNQILAILDFLEKMEPDYNNVFSIEKSFSETSKALALASLTNIPSISFSYYPQFNVDSIKGFIGGKADHEECEVKPNFYKEDSNNYALLSTFFIPPKEDPLKNPLWNIKSSNYYMQKIRFSETIQGKDKNEQRQMLIAHGRVIAEMNGWTYSEALSKRNSTNGKKRKIFISLGFKNQNAYLCIDLRHPDLHFELCNKRGHHVGEFSWNGEKLHDSQENHDIEV
jgi:hypothetical protein